MNVNDTVKVWRMIEKKTGRTKNDANNRQESGKNKWRWEEKKNESKGRMNVIVRTENELKTKQRRLWKKEWTIHKKWWKNKNGWRNQW